LKIQRTRRRPTPKARGMRTCRARSLPRICSALNHPHPASGPSRRSSRSIRARIPDVARGCEQSVFVTAPDALRLHVRSYGSRVASALPVVCLPGLARTAADLHRGGGDGGRLCQAAPCIGARLSRPRPIRIRSQPRPLHASRPPRRPLRRPDHALSRCARRSGICTISYCVPGY
jgi:hypothetical protein